MKKIFSIYVLLLIVSLSFLFKTELMFGKAYDGGRSAERIRSFIAAAIFKRADDLMHKGAIDPENQHFKAGSYVGNTDIIPLLKLVTFIAPEEPAPYQILSRSLAYARGKTKEGIRILQRGIAENYKHAAVHELYASIALLKMFFESEPMTYEDKISAIKYLNAACEKYESDSESVSSDPAFTLENYKILTARLFVELNKPSEALKTLEEAGISLSASDDILFSYLSDYKMSGVGNIELFSDVGRNPKDDSDSHENSFHVRAHDHDEDHEKESTPPLKPFFSALKAGLIFVALLISGYVKKDLY